MKDFEKASLPEGAHPILKADIVFLNDKYQVNVRLMEDNYGWKGLVWLSIKRLDKEAIHDWRDLQIIKNKLCGDEREAVEVYPAESRLVDTSNQFHLWVLPEGEKMPFGYGDRLVVDGHNDSSKQRPFNEDEKPVDCTSLEDVQKLLKETAKESGDVRSKNGVFNVQS